MLSHVLPRVNGDLAPSTCKSKRNESKLGPHAIESGAEVSWQRQLASAVRDPAALLARVGLSDAAASKTADLEFPLLVPESFIARMEMGNRRDPLLLQVLPTETESLKLPGFINDPVGDADAKTESGLLQKYNGRVLLITTGACAVHCRYCFRRNYPYHDDPRTMHDWQPAFDSIRNDDSIHEVILSGGDPLMLTDQRLEQILSQLDEISHVQRIRFHSRLPIVLPARVTSLLVDMISKLRSQVIMVVHANHGNEIVGDCEDGLQRLVRAGVPVLNQAVLLKNVNDSVDAMFALCQRLVNIGVMPYYLHQLDRVIGAAHFEVDEAVGKQIVDALSGMLPGYAVPRFVREVPGADGKTLIH